MITTRRQMLWATAAIATAIAVPMRALAQADEAIEAYTGGAEAGSEGITLTAPEIAENGNTVPIEVEAPGASEIAIYAAGNPVPDVGVFKFGALAASQLASTRIRLAGTQDVIAIAKMPDGTYLRAQQEVKVTIGGCGG
ncbi:thiosulfate oxidation carrier protein SoxY [Roseobacter sp. HKCCA0434]|uniref:thiosulfate oxidation carrier protein SoxY n=1 Tax=Roseobacter sp. HKCCA0434 TaxID=3079297 RepID=UPI002905D250|nr:thiosulfate oxidation carrier protein SoxY [Roseobacter sp. HKCCA0434]